MTAGKERDMLIVFEMARDNDQTLVLALDNDLEGRKMREKLLHLAEESGCNYETEVPRIGKKWEEELLENEKENIYQSISERRWEMFEQLPYEGSILTKIGIEKETLEAFKDTLKIGDKDMLVACREVVKQEISSTWRLEILSSGEARVIVDEIPEMSILKGNPQRSSELVLVTSPLDALVHYQSLEAKGDICYGMVNPKELENSLLELVEQDNWKHIVVAGGEKNIEAKRVHDFLREEKREVEEVSLSLEDLQQHVAENLGISKRTIEDFKEKFKVELEQDVNQLSEKGEQVAGLAEKGKLEENKNSFSVIYGDIKEAEKIVLVASKNDAMLHYERGKATGQEDFKTCYVLGEVGEKELLKQGAKRLQAYAQNREIERSIVSSKENMPGARSLRYAFKQDSMRLYIERLKKEIPLADFLEQELDWKRPENRSGRENDVLTHPKSGENIIIPRLAQENGHRLFSYQKGGGGGKIIDLLVEEKWDWKQIAKLAEKKFLPKIEEVEIPSRTQILASFRQEQVNIHMSPISSAFSRNDGNPLEENVPSMALGALSLLASLMKASYCANQGGREEDEQPDRDKKEEQEKVRGFGR